jgi:hypothetical protein
MPTLRDILCYYISILKLDNAANWGNCTAKVLDRNQLPGVIMHICDKVSCVGIS